MNPFWPSRPDDGEQAPPLPTGPLGFGGAATDIDGDLARRRGQGHPSFRRPAGATRRVIALAIDLALLTALGTVLWLGASAMSKGDWLMTVGLGVLFVVRPALLAFTGATLGQWLTHYRVVGSNGERLSLKRALWRELNGLVSLTLVLRMRWRQLSRWAPIEASPFGTVRRWPHDQEANTWPVLTGGS